MKVTRLPRGRLPRVAVSVAAAMTVLFSGVGVAQADDIVVFTNYHTGRCIDDSIEQGLRTFTCNGMDYQQWRVHRVNGLVASLENVHTGRCIDYSEAVGLRSFPCNGTMYQQWALDIGDEIWPAAPNPNPQGLELDDSFEFGLRAFPGNNLDYQKWHH